MAKSKKKPVTRDAICSALQKSAADFLRQVGKAYPGETLYAFLFEISCEGFAAHGAAATEEGLARYAQDQLAEVKPIKTADPLATLRSCFRWAGPEDGWYQQPESAFAAVNKLLSRAEAEGLYEMYDGSLSEICLLALREMDQARLFGTGKERGRVVIGICNIGGDNSDEEFLAWAKQVNSPSVMKRLRQELKQSRKDSDRVRYL